MNEHEAFTKLQSTIGKLLPEISRSELLDVGYTLGIEDKDFYIQAWLDEKEGWAVGVYNPGRIYTDAIGTMGTLAKSDGRYKVTGLRPAGVGKFKPYTRIEFTIEDIDTIEPTESMINLRGDKLDDAYSLDA